MSKANQTDRAYLKTVSQPTQICNFPTNHSPTKQLYSFPHSERFSSFKLNYNCQAEFYNVNENLFRGQRTCSLGKGQRFDFSKMSKNTPSPNAYFPRNQTIEFNKEKGYSFGIARDNYPQAGIVPFLKLEAQKPGPGSYCPAFPKSGIVSTFHIRPLISKSGCPNVGPGKYDVLSTFQPNKQMMISKYRSAKNIKIAPIRAVSNKEGHKKENLRPLGNEGVMIFDKTYQINKNGVFFNSKYKNSMCRYFNKVEKDSKLKVSDYPGPGEYRQISEFGFYESSKFAKN